MFLDCFLYSKFPIKKLDFHFSVVYLWFIGFDEDFSMPPKENKVNDGRENQN